MADEEIIADVNQFDALLVIAQRSYDMLSIIASAVDPEGFAQVLALHKDHEFFGPPPSFRTSKETE